MEANNALRKKNLGGHEVGITVVAATLLKPEWKLDVEAFAAAQGFKRPGAARIYQARPYCMTWAARRPMDLGAQWG